MKNIAIAISNICSAFEPVCIGTKVLCERDNFLWALADAVEFFDFPANGQAKIELPDWLHDVVSCGQAQRLLLDANDFVIRKHRGKISLYAKREFAARTQKLYAIVYTREAYLKDPDVVNDSEEQTRIRETNPTHVLVALLAFAEESSAYGSRVLVHNIAGGNNEFIPRTSRAQVEGWRFNGGRVFVAGSYFAKIANDLGMLHRWIALAKETEVNEMEWVGVAD